MLSNDQKKMNEAISEMAVVSKRLQAVLAVVLAALVCMGAVFVFRVLSNAGGLSGIAPVFASQVSAGLLLIAAGGVVVVTLIRILADSMTSHLPFSRIQARRLFVVGVVLVACAVAVTLASAGSAFAAGAEGLGADTIARIQIPMAYADILLIVAAVVSFYLSYIFKYGSFLQWIYDETI